MLLEAGRRTQLCFGEGGNSGEAICNPTGLRDLLPEKCHEVIQAYEISMFSGKQAGVEMCVASACACSTEFE